MNNLLEDFSYLITCVNNKLNESLLVPSSSSSRSELKSLCGKYILEKIQRENLEDIAKELRIIRKRMNASSKLVAEDVNHLISVVSPHFKNKAELKDLYQQLALYLINNNLSLEKDFLIKLKDSKQVGRILKTQLSRSPSHVFSGLHELQNQSQLLRIAKSMGRLNPRITCMNFRKFHIEDSQSQLEVAKEIVKHDPSQSVYYLRNFDLSPEDGFILARFAAQHIQTAHTIARYLQELNIENPEWIQEIVQIAFDLNPEALIYELDLLPLTSEMIFDFLKQGALKNIEDFGHLLSRYELTSEQREEMMELLALHNAKELIVVLNSNHGADPLKCWKLFLKATSRLSPFEQYQSAKKTNDPEIMRRYFSHLSDCDPVTVRELVQKAYDFNPCNAINELRFFPLRHADLFVFLKMAVIQKVDGISFFLINFELTNEEWMELAHLLARQSPTELTGVMSSYPIEDPAQRFEIFLEAFNADSQTLGSYENYLQLEAYDPSLCLILEGLRQEIIDSGKLLRNLQSYFDTYCPEWDLKPLFNMSAKEKNELNRLHLLHGLAYLAAFNSPLLGDGQLSGDERRWIASQGLIADVFLNSDPNLRLNLLYALVQICRSSPSRKLYETLNGENTSARVRHLHLLLGVFHAIGVEKSELRSIATSPSIPSLMKVPQQAKIVLNVLTALIQNRCLEAADKTRLLQMVFIESARPLPVLHTIQDILYFERVDALKKDALTGKDQYHLEALCKQAFHQRIPVGEMSDFGPKYANSFGLFRRPEALLIYAAHLNKLPHDEREVCLQLLASFCRMVVSGTFKTERYDPKYSVHLKQIFENDPALAEKWPVDEERSLGMFVHDVEIDFKKILMEEIFVDQLDLSHFPFIQLFLENEVDGTTWKRLTHAISSSKDQGSEELYKDLMFQKFCIQLMNPDFPLAKKGALLNKLSVYLMEKEIEGVVETIEGVRLRIKKSLKVRASVHPGWIVANTDDANDLLLSGTETPTCQNVEGGTQNKCLLALLLDGKNRLIAIKNEKGEIVARAILRLLWDDSNNAPALFFEKIYPQDLPQPLRKTLLGMAKLSAKRLGLPLYSLEGKSSYISVNLRSLGSIAPFEYVDVKGGLRPNSGVRVQGKFKIKRAKLIA